MWLPRGLEQTMLPAMLVPLTWMALGFVICAGQPGSALQKKGAPPGGAAPKKGYFTTVPNDGHPLCGFNQYASWPYVMCWGSAATDITKKYQDLWYTMELLTGWPGKPRVPKLQCGELQIDCAASYICTAILEYNKAGPMPVFGDDADRAATVQCLMRQCPNETQVGMNVLHGAGECPHTHLHAKTSGGSSPQANAPETTPALQAPAGLAMTTSRQISPPDSSATLPPAPAGLTTKPVEQALTASDAVDARVLKKPRPLHSLDLAVGLFIVVIVLMLGMERIDWTQSCPCFPDVEHGNRGAE
jgi:hypothetical protein